MNATGPPTLESILINLASPLSTIPEEASFSFSSGVLSVIQLAHFDLVQLILLLRDCYVMKTRLPTLLLMSVSHPPIALCTHQSVNPGWKSWSAGWLNGGKRNPPRRLACARLLIAMRHVHITRYSQISALTPPYLPHRTSDGELGAPSWQEFMDPCIRSLPLLLLCRHFCPPAVG